MKRLMKLPHLSTAPLYLGILFSLLLLQILATRFSTKIDVTEDQVYSVSEESHRLLASLPHRFHVKFFYSSSRKQLPATIKAYGARVEGVLRALQTASGGKMALEVFDPLPDSEEAEWAHRFGIAGAALPDGEIVYLGAVVLRGHRETAIAYFDPTRERFLEYDLAEAIYRTSQEEKPKVAVLTTLNMMGSDLPFSLPNVPTAAPWIAISELRKTFEVRKLPNNTTEIPAEFSILLVVHPKNFSDQTLYAVDQFLMRGGKLLVAVDPLSRLDLPRISSVEQMKTIPNPSSDFDKLLRPWGINYGNAVIGDLKNPARMVSNGQTIAYPMFISVKKGSLASTSVITNQLNEVVIAEGGSFELLEGSKLAFEPLLSTSSDSGVFPDPFLAGYVGHSDLDRQLKIDGKARTLAAVVRGEFPSAFPNGAPASAAKSPEETKRKLASPPTSAALSRSTSGATLLLLGDTDFLRNENSVQVVPSAGGNTLRPTNDNLRFFQAAVEYMAGNEHLIALRARGQVSRPFTRLQDLEKAAQIKWRSEDERLERELRDLESKLSALQERRSKEEKLQLSPEQLAEVAHFRAREAEAKKARKTIRRRLREDIDQLGNLLALLNIGFVPTAVGAYGFFFFFRRYRRMRKGLASA